MHSIDDQPENSLEEKIKAEKETEQLLAPEILDPINMPLTGQALIEASAGTGKTYTLAALYLRLLLGVGTPSPLEVNRILVVTFTDAATQELRERIRSRIQEARVAFVLGESEDHFIKQLLALHQDHERAVLDLEFAASEMDQAAVFTIHGFCQRMLKQHAFESGANFNAQLINDDSAIVRQALLDYWRQEVYLAPDELAHEILSAYATPDRLLSQIRSYLGLSGLQLEPDYQEFALAENWQLFQAEQVQLRIELQQVFLSTDPGDDLQALIQNSSANKRSYTKKNLPTWYAKLQLFAQGEKAPFKELMKFSQSHLVENSKTDEVARHHIFEKIEAFCAQQINIKAVIFCRALAAVKRNMRLEKHKQQQLSFDDLLQKLAGALQSNTGDMLANAIRKQYPFALIDEFQDTDPEQYAIFSTLYSSNDVLADSEPAESGELTPIKPVPANTLGLLMIGDPKQSIYSFRGADIFTYMTARRQVTKHYTLGTNWRSSSAMVSATNQLFSRSPAPFLYKKDIPFYRVSAANKSVQTLSLYKQPVSAMSFWLSDKSVNNDQYLTDYATICAAHISRMLEHGEINQQPVTPANIAVLVRDRKEASLIQQALTKVHVDSVFMSNRENVYSMDVARELQYILQAVNDPSNERFLRTALATTIFQLTGKELFELNQDEQAWESLVEEFINYRKIWWRSGVLAMLHALLQQRKLAQRWLSSQSGKNSGERRLTDYLHLAELLQQASAELESNEALMRFLQDKRHQSANSAQEQQLRLDSDRSRVTVITIHKSKGLEYDLVYLPFACRYKSAQNQLFHDDDGQAILDANASSSLHKEAIEKEQLAEDLRLLYVAITRAAHGCFIGMADVCLRNKSVWQKTAIGYLLTLISQNNESTWLEGISVEQALTQLAGENEHIEMINTGKIDLAQADLFGDDLVTNQNPVEKSSAPALSVRAFNRRMQHQWRVTSYSALSQNHTQYSDNTNNEVSKSALDNDRLDLEVAAEAHQKDAELLTDKNIFTFAKGAVAGTFLHTIYEEIDFSTAGEPEGIDEIIAVLEKRLPLSGFDLEWVPSLAAFVQQSLNVPLHITNDGEEANNNASAFCLKDIAPVDRLVEMEFVLPFKTVHHTAINSLLKRFDPLAKRAGELKFHQVSGMLKGFIDLTLRHNNQYYVVDYKSNYLGDAVENYQQESMAESMIEHRYDFQYVLYTLALHRFLRSRLLNYDYEKDIGGVFYLFLRGLQADSPTGVFYTKPDKALIEHLDQLFEEGV